MSGVVAELQNLANGSEVAGDALAAKICRDAIVEIERLREQNRKLKSAIAPARAIIEQIKCEVVEANGEPLPMRELVFAEEVVGSEGGWLVSLDCGHKIATRKRLVSYPCRECAAEAKKDLRENQRALDQLLEHEESRRGEGGRQNESRDEM